MAVNFYDADIFDQDLADGRINIVYGDDAISNAMILYCTSSKGDFVRRPDDGGLLRPLLYKQLTALSAESINFYRTQIEAQFQNIASIEEFTINADNINRSWNITLRWRNTQTQQVNDVVFYLQNPTPTPIENKVVYVNVYDVGENLYAFVQMNIDNYVSGLDKNIITGYYTWGPFQFVNLTNADPYFTAIQSLIGSTL